MPLNFQDRPSASFARIVLVVLVVISIALMTLYAREGNEGVLHRVQGVFQGIAAPIESVGAVGGSAIKNVTQATENATADESTLNGLRQRNAELTEQLTQAEEYRQEVERLEGLLNMKNTYGIQGVSGHVIGRSTDAWNQTITIDVGSNDGVETGLTVMGPNGVVGQVVSVAPGSSVVRLLTDPQSGAAAMVQSSRAEGIVRGSLAGVLYLENVSADVNLSIGDVVLTSGLGGSYTRGLLIGTIVRIEGSSTDATRRIVVAPNEVASALEEITVVFSATSSQPSEDEGQDSSNSPNSSDTSNSSSSSSDDDSSGSEVGQTYTGQTRSASNSSTDTTQAEGE